MKPDSEMNLEKITIKISFKVCLFLVIFYQGLAAAEILDLASGKEISEPVLAERLRSADIVLLG